MQVLSSLAPLASTYDVFVLDLWGCVHDGSRLYPGARACLQQLRARSKKILFLSNAPRRTWKVMAVLDQLGIERTLYDAVLSSGEAGWLALRDTPPGRSGTYFYIGPERDADVLEGLPYVAVQHIRDADFILNVGFGSESENAGEWNAILQDAGKRRLPMICLNPDMEVVKITGERFACAGVIAKEYEEMGGRVTYFGKPYPHVYDLAFSMMGNPSKKAAVAVGDGLATDIRGARNFGIASALVTGGILQQQHPQSNTADLHHWLARQEVLADYVLPGLLWE